VTWFTRLYQVWIETAPVIVNLNLKVATVCHGYRHRGPTGMSTGISNRFKCYATHFISGDGMEGADIAGNCKKYPHRVESASIRGMPKSLGQLFG
jgi:hypothetical protein